MTDPMIEGIVGAAVSQSFVTNWLMFSLYAAIMVVVSYFGARIGGEAKKSGELAAIKGKYDEILDQLKLATRASEEIKAEIGLAEWSRREWNATRKLKLEELLDCVYRCQTWLPDTTMVVLSTHDVADIRNESFDRFSSLHKLYFPELFASATAFALHYQGSRTSIIAATTAARRADRGQGYTVEGLDAFKAVLPVELGFSQGPLAAFEDAAAELMRSLSGVEPVAAPRAAA